MATSVYIVVDHYMVIERIRSLLQNEKNIEWTGHECLFLHSFSKTATARCYQQ